MKKALISIGIGRTGGSLPPLKGAVQDARDIYAWGQRQGFDCTLLVDEANKVRVADAFEALQEYLNAGTYSQIVVYFSGHGILQAPGCELWLMSAAPGNPNEVINVPASMTNARSCGLEHVVFISDACRTLPTNLHQAALGQGGHLFPYLNIQSPLPELDVYYATLPGDPAHEITGDEAAKRERGLFTGCLLDALSGGVHEVLTDLDISGVLSRVVHGRPLKIWLATAVPIAAEHASVVLRQKPEIRIESDNSKFLARFSSNHQPPNAASVSAQHHHSVDSVNGANRAARRLIPSRAARAGACAAHNPARTTAANSPQPTDSRFRDQLAQSLAIASSFDADIAVFGGAVTAGFWHHGKLKESSRGDAFLLHLPETVVSEAPMHPLRRTLTLTLEDGSCIPLNAPQGYVTTVNLDGVRIGSINCVAKRRSAGGGGSPTAGAEIDQLRIEAALLARSRETLARLARRCRPLPGIG